MILLILIISDSSLPKAVPLLPKCKKSSAYKILCGTKILLKVGKVCSPMCHGKEISGGDIKG